MPARGLLISWAIEAARRPSDDSFSDCTSLAWASFSSAVRFSTCCSSVASRWRRSARDFDSASIISLYRLQSPQFVGGRHPDLLRVVTRRHLLRGAHQFGDRADERPPCEEAHQAHEADRREPRDRHRTTPQRRVLPIDVRERHPDVDHAQDALLLWVRVAGRVPAGLFVVDGGDHADHAVVADGVDAAPRPRGQPLERPAGFVTAVARLFLLVDEGVDLRRLGRERDPALLVEESHTLHAGLLADRVHDEYAFSRRSASMSW